MELDLSLKYLLRKAWKVRLTNFPRLIKFVRPVKTLPVSLTGTSCELNCSHCGGHYLKGMKHPDLIDFSDGKQLSNYYSFLISGGSNEQGKVPFVKNIKFIERLSRHNKKINLHPGLVDKEDAPKTSLVDVCSLDFTVDENLIKKTYGLRKSAIDYLDSYVLLKEYTNRVVPHIAIGLPGKSYRGELGTIKALEEFKNDLQVDAVTFIAFVPTRGTAFENYPLPFLEYVGKILSLARLEFPEIPLYLGCMRPGGKYRERLDKIAFNSGVNKIVSPTPGVKNLARKKGFGIEWEKECCAL